MMNASLGETAPMHASGFEKIVVYHKFVENIVQELFMGKNSNHFLLYYLIMAAVIFVDLSITTQITDTLCDVQLHVQYLVYSFCLPCTERKNTIVDCCGWIW